MSCVSAYLWRSLLVVHGGGRQDDLEQPERGQKDLAVAVQRARDEP
jgi:hypothetical protein